MPDVKKIDVALGDVVEFGPFLRFTEEPVSMMATKVSDKSTGKVVEFDATYYGIHLATVVATEKNGAIEWGVKK